MRIAIRPPLEIRTLSTSRASVWRVTALAGVVALAAAFRFANLSALGLANHYYAAAVESMSQSWSNFFFAAAEPGGAVSVDKPPVGLWFQVISAHWFGVTGFGVLLPQLLAGLLSVIVVYHLVSAQSGTFAGLLAAVALAVTPVVVATDRNNTMDSTLILTLLLAAWAFQRATASQRMRDLALGVALVGIGFNIKMLQAFLPLPAFYALYLLGSSERLWRKLGKLALATLLLLAISLSWSIAVDLTPANQRPFVGSSAENSEIDLMLGYNGLNRLLGMGGRGGGPGGLFGDGGRGFPQPGGGMGALSPSIWDLLGGLLGGGASRGPGFGGFGNGFDIGRPGLLRLFMSPLSNEMSWLLPFGLVGAALLLVRARPQWPIMPKHQALVLWGGWLVTGGVFFSVAGFFHPYYLAMLGAPLAALVGIAGGELWEMRARRPGWAMLVLLPVAAGTLLFQLATARAYVTSIWWGPIAVGLLIAGAGMLAAGTSRPWQSAAAAGFALTLAALGLTPGIWSGLTTLNASENQSLPSAYGGRSNGPANRGDVQVNETLLAYLQAETQGVRYLMAVPSSMQGADYVLATGRPVLYLGGFSGNDQVVTGNDLEAMVARGELRFVYWNNTRGGGGFRQRSDITDWVTTHCAAVDGYEVMTRNTGAPDGTTGGTGWGGPGAAMPVSLYRCGE